MNLNSINILYILKRLSCCISNLGNNVYIYSQIGNNKCIDNIKNDIIILNSIYNILNANFNPNIIGNISCFTQDQLNELYQQSLNLCKDCNCN